MTKKVGKPKLQVEYELPPVIASLLSGWITIFGSAATVSGLLASVETTLLVLYKTPDVAVASSERSYKAILVLTYTALLFSISSTFSSLILADTFAELPARAAQRFGELPEKGAIVGDSWTILRLYGLRPSVSWIMLHWISSLLIACFAAVAQLVLFAFNNEPPAVKGPVTAVAIIALFPVIYFTVNHIFVRD
ncbi:hypothetical protein BDW22DRAFT_338723 [Trametopsis cervina]|nr:hypothetical protein BDW22DRAFT_338723 [Trametopsis cervina]